MFNRYYSNHFCRSAQILLPGLIILALMFLAGCNSKSRFVSGTCHRPVNPYFIFNSGGHSTGIEYVADASKYQRKSWPVAQTMEKRVSSGEIITYREEIFAHQWSNASNIPRDDFRYRTRTSRTGYVVR